MPIEIKDIRDTMTPTPASTALPSTTVTTKPSEKTDTKIRGRSSRNRHVKKAHRTRRRTSESGTLNGSAFDRLYAALADAPLEDRLRGLAAVAVMLADAHAARSAARSMPLLPRSATHRQEFSVQ